MHWRNPVEVITEAMSIGHKSPQWREPLYKKPGGPKQTAGPVDINAIVCDCVEAGKVLAAVDALHAVGRVYRSWAWFCYGPTEHRSDRADVIEYAWARVYRKRKNFDQTHKLANLAALAVEEARHVARTDARKYAEAELRHVLDVTRQSWAATYKPVFDETVEALLSVNSVSLKPILGLIYQAKRAERMESI